MAIWKALLSSGVRAYFKVISGTGDLAAGIDPADFTVFIINPQDSAKQSLTAVESSQQSGVYYVDIPSAFLGTHGVGQYGLSIGVHQMAPPINDEVLESVEVTSTDFDDLATGADMAIVKKILRNRWKIDRNNKQMIIYDNDKTTPILTFNLFDKDGNPSADGPYFERNPQ
jgi:hypothetical protein